MYFTEDYPEICHVFYRACGCVAFEFYAPSQVFFNGTPLLGRKRKRVEGLFCGLDGYESRSDSFYAYNGDLGFYAPFGKIESVYISRKGYSAEQAAFYKKKLDETYGV